MPGLVDTLILEKEQAGIRVAELLRENETLKLAIADRDARIAELEAHELEANARERGKKK